VLSSSEKGCDKIAFSFCRKLNKLELGEAFFEWKSLELMKVPEGTLIIDNDFHQDASEGMEEIGK